MGGRGVWGREVSAGTASPLVAGTLPAPGMEGTTFLVPVCFLRDLEGTWAPSLEPTLTDVGPASCQLCGLGHMTSVL